MKHMEELVGDVDYADEIRQRTAVIAYRQKQLEWIADAHEELEENARYHVKNIAELMEQTAELEARERRQQAQTWMREDRWMTLLYLSDAMVMSASVWVLLVSVFRMLGV